MLESIGTECGLVGGILVAIIIALVKDRLTTQAQILALHDRLDKRYADILALVPSQTVVLERLERTGAELVRLSREPPRSQTPQPVSEREG